MSVSTMTFELPRLDLELRNEWNNWDDLIQVGRAMVEVEFDFDRGQREIVNSAPEDCEPGYPDQVTIYSIKLTAPLVFSGDVSECTLKAGTDLFERVSPSEVTRLEDEILKACQVHA
jgi:hypothetical protein